MISLRGNRARFCDGYTRRDALCVGGLSLLGLALPDLLRARAAEGRGLRGEHGAAHSERRTTSAERPPRAKACILFYLQGGQSHIDVWDMKPDAPEGIRGEFRPVGTNVPGIRITEHLPKLGKLADRYAIIRSMTHRSTNHNPGGYTALTAGIPKRDVNNLPVSPDDLPHPGSIISLLQPTKRPVPSFVQLSGSMVGDSNVPMPGQGAGLLSARYEPLRVSSDPSAPNFSVDELSLPGEVDSVRLAGRRSLLQTVESAFPLAAGSAEIARMDSFYQRAFSMVTSPDTRRAFDLSQESEKTRDLYGRHVHGQRLLLARRLVEAGVRLVTVYWGGPLNAPDDYWDTHKANFPKQKETLLPPFDHCFAGLLTDLEQRGLLDETLVIAMGEFGRTPKIGQITANAATDASGRDHWPFCYSLVVAGGGVRGGQVVGASDELGAYPAERPVTPDDFLATVYDAMGIDLHAEIHDQLGRPLPITRGSPVTELFG